MRLKKDIQSGSIEGVFRAYPIIDDERRILWPEKYRDIESVKRLSKRFTDVVWVREFLLKSLSANGHELIHPIITTNYGDKSRTQEERSVRLPPRQVPLIPQMKEFKISVPYDNAPIYLLMDDNPEYLLYFGNVYLNEPMMSGSERAAEMKALADDLVEKLKNGTLDR